MTDSHEKAEMAAVLTAGLSQVGNASRIAAGRKFDYDDLDEIRCILTI